MINVRHRCPHPARERLVVMTRFEWIDPYHLAGDEMQASHLTRKHLGISSVETIRDDDDRRTPGETPDSEKVVESLERLSKTCSP